MHFPKNNSQNNFKTTDFFFRQSWRILSSENEEHKQKLQPPKKILESEQAYHNFLLSTKNHKYYKTKRNHFFKDILDYNNNYIKKFNNDPHIIPSSGDFVYKNDPNLFESKKDRKTNENNHTFREANSTEKAKMILQSCERKKAEIKRNSLSKNLEHIINNEDFQKTYQSFHGNQNYKTPNDKLKTALNIFSKNRRKTDKKSKGSPDTLSPQGNNSTKKLSRVLSFKSKITQFPSSKENEKPFYLNEDYIKKNRNTFYFPTQPKSSQIQFRMKINGRKEKVVSEHVPKTVTRTNSKNFIVEEFVKNYELLINAVKSDTLHRYILKKIKHLEMVKKVMLDNKELRRNCFNREFLYELLNSKSVLWETSEGKVMERGREKFLIELNCLNNDLEGFIIEKNKEELNYVENSLINSYEEYKMKELSLENTKEKNQVNFYKNATFEKDIDMIRKNFENSLSLSKDLDTFEWTFGECGQINNKEKKIMRNMDLFYRDLQKRFENVKDKYKGDNPYFVI